MRGRCTICLCYMEALLYHEMTNCRGCRCVLVCLEPVWLAGGRAVCVYHVRRLV